MIWILAFLSGLGAAFGLQPYNLWPLSFVALALWLALLRQSKTNRQAFFLGWFFAFGYFWLGLDWIAQAFTHQANMPSWLGFIAVPLLSCYLSCYLALGTLAARYFIAAVHSPFSAWKRANLSTIPIWRWTLVVAGCWTISEWIKSWLFAGFPWNPLGVIWLNLLPVAEIARWIGSYALSAMAILVAGALLSLYEIIFPNRTKRLFPAQGWSRFLPAILIIMPIVAWTLIAGYDVRWLWSDKKPIHLVIVQPNIPQDEKADTRYQARHAAIFTRLSGKAEPYPRMILWPEDAVQTYLEEDPFTRTHLSEILAPRDLLLLGGDALVSNDEGRIIAVRNSLFVLNAKGILVKRYDKANLVPFGEFMPFRHWASYLGLARLVPGDLDFIPGPGAESFNFKDFGSVGIQICYEIVFSGRVVDRFHRPDFIFNLSNDSWFGVSGPPQHLAQARLRAIEEGLPIARATSTGISALIDAEGHIIDQLPVNRAGRLSVVVPPAMQPTFFARYGNRISLIFAMSLLLITLLGRIKAR
ncbi:MAG: apolipoprotein N-acyltransferase [Zymomonas mobilis subsp. pomaceae]|uniref:apolipoprotein N-acyltransferase n=1 Tax=Zymomonas mobilis TaxID=542 RepID=UPI0039EB156A